MIRFYARSLIAIGLVGVIAAGGRLAVVGLSHAPAAAASESPAVYFACPEGGPAHKPGCLYVDWARTDMVRLPGPRAIEASGLERCEHCLSESTQRTASARSPLPVPIGTAPPQTRHSGG